MIRVGIVGCGEWGRRYVAAIRRTGLGRVVRAYRVRSSVRGSEDLQGVKEVTTLEAVMNSVDAVVISSPPGTRALAVEMAVHRQLPVMMEKPLALGLSDSMALVRLACRSTSPLLVNHLHLFAPAYEVLRSEFFGASDLEIESAGCGFGPFRDYSPLWDYGPHDASMAFGLGLNLVSCATTVRDTLPGSLYEVRATYLHGCRSTSSIGNGAPSKSRLFRIRSLRHEATYDDIASDKLVLDGSPVPVSSDLPLDRSVRSFLDAVRTGRVDWRFGPKPPAWVASFLDMAEASVKC